MGELASPYAVLYWWPVVISDHSFKWLCFLDNARDGTDRQSDSTDAVGAERLIIIDLFTMCEVGTKQSEVRITLYILVII